MGGQRQLIRDFLAQQTIAVVGLSRSRMTPGNAIARQLHGAGYTVYPVHPAAGEIDGMTCRPDLAAVPDPLDGVMLATRPDVTRDLVDECIALGVPRIWMHNKMGTNPRIGKADSEKNGSVSAEGAEKARNAGIAVITGSCPMQFVAPVDAAHRCIAWFNLAVGNTR